MKKLLLLLLALSLLAFAPGCETEYGEEPVEDYDALMAEGVAALGYADSAVAHDRFIRAQNVRAGDAAAGLGVALSDVQGLAELVDELLSFVLELTATAEPTLTTAVGNPGGLAPGSTIGDTIHHFIKQILEPVLDEMLPALTDAATDPQLEIMIPSLPIVVMDTTLIDLGGQWDANDVRWLLSLIHTAQGAIDVVQGLDLTLDVGPLLAMDFLRDLLTGQELDIEAGLTEIAATLIWTLEDPENPTFLLPLPDETWRFDRAHVNFAQAGRFATGIWTKVAAEVDLQQDDLFGYNDVNRNHRRDGGETFFFACAEYSPLVMQMTPGFEAVIADLATAFAEGTDLDATPGAVDTFDPATLNDLLTAFGLPALIPSDSLNLADFFTDPPMQDLKTWLIDVLQLFVGDEDA
jgi:hypothetical protein